MKFYERKEILEGIKYISSVVKFDDRDDTANALITQVRTTYNGGMFNHTYDDVNPTEMIIEYILPMVEIEVKVIHLKWMYVES